MELIVSEINGKKVAEITIEGVVITRAQDALDLMMHCSYQDIQRLCLKVENLAPAFFDLRSGLAGDILQKFSNYRMKLAVVGDFTPFASQSLAAFMTESNRGNQIFFAADRETALRNLTR